MSSVKGCHKSLFLGMGLVGLLIVSPQIQAAQIIFSTTAEGSLAMTGNTIGLSNALNANCPGTMDSIGTFTAIDHTMRDLSPEGCDHGSWPLGTTSNWRSNGSSGMLELPFDASILRAELVWGGSWSYGSESVASELNTPVLLRAESGAEINVTPSPATAVTLDHASLSGTFRVHYYVRSAEVTDFIQDHGAGMYTVGGIPATQDHNIGTLNAGGWVLVVAFEESVNKTHPQRNLSIFVGADWVDELQQEDYIISGFCTPPSGPRSGRVLLAAVEGDANRLGNQVLIGDPPHTGFVPLEAPYNPVNNFFSSQINDIYGQRDTRGSFGERNHDPFEAINIPGGRQGWDITGVSLTSEHLRQGQTAATIRAISGDDADSFAMMMVALQVDINAPSFFVSWSSFVLNNDPQYEDSAEVGDVLTYYVFLDNWGTADADEVLFTMPLPEGLLLRGFYIDGVEGDAFGRAVSPESLSTGVNIGTISWYDEVLVEIDVQVTEVPNSPSPASFETQAAWSYEFISCEGDDPISSVAWSDRLVMPSPRLESRVRAEPEGPYYPQDTLTIIIEVENTGLANTREAMVEVNIPSGFSYVSGSTRVGGTAVADLAGEMPFIGSRSVKSPGQAEGVVLPGSTITIEFQVQIDDDPPYQPTIVVTSDTDGDGPAPARITRFPVSVDDPLAVCGNGILEGGEECDDGNALDGDGCSSSCQIEDGWDCEGEPSDCYLLPVCGNGIIEDGEACDDGNTLSGDGCSSSCQIEDGWDCEGEPSECYLLPVCGNGIIEDGEACDDGNTYNNDGCSSTCQIEDGWDCEGEPSECSRLPVCGNGLIEAGEECDDGDTIDGDGCSSSCQIEDGWECAGEPSVCIELTGEEEEPMPVLVGEEACGCSSAATRQPLSVLFLGLLGLFALLRRRGHQPV